MPPRRVQMGMGWPVQTLRLGGCAAAALMLASCGSQAQQDRNNAAMDAQLAAANASIAEGDGRDQAAPTDADQVGQAMRAASAKPPPR